MAIAFRVIIDWNIIVAYTANVMTHIAIAINLIILCYYN